MPFCAYPRCGAVVERGYCPAHIAHQRTSWRTQTPAPPRIRGAKLQKLRKALFDKQPLCVLCHAEGKISMATIRDHIVNLQAGGHDTEANVQAICESCHETKTQAESRYGREKLQRHQ